MKKRYIGLILIIFLLIISFSIPYLANLDEEMIPYPSITIGDTILENDFEIYSYAQPIFLEGNNGESVLLIHGFLASPQEVEDLAYSLNEDGYTVFAPLMSGHGTDSDALKEISWEDWAEESDYYYSLLIENYNKVHVIGFSLGTLSALELSTNYDLDSLTVIGTPLFIFRHELNSSDLGFLVEEYAEHFSYLKKGNTFIDLFMGRKTYLLFPPESILEVIEYSNEVKYNLGAVDDSILIVHGKYDTTSDPYSAEYLYDNISSEEKSIFYVNSLHPVLSGLYQDSVYEEIFEFITLNLESPE
jgi:carboxylesterase